MSFWHWAPNASRKDFQLPSQSPKTDSCRGLENMSILVLLQHPYVFSFASSIGRPRESADPGIACTAMRSQISS